MAIFRGTSPALTISVTGTDFSDCAKMYVSIRQEYNLITKTDNDVVIQPGEEEDTAVITVFYTQDDMLSMLPGEAWLQLRWKDTNDLALASQAVKIAIHDILMEGEI